MQRNSYGAYGILTEFSLRQRRNGNGSTATEGWKPGVTRSIDDKGPLNGFTVLLCDVRDAANIQSTFGYWWSVGVLRIGCHSFLGTLSLSGFDVVLRASKEKMLRL